MKTYKGILYDSIITKMKFFQFLASLLFVTRVPSGMYSGSKTLFGETINAVVIINDEQSLDFAVTGDFTLDCKDEHYSLVEDEIVLHDIELVGNCAHDALMDYGIVLKGIFYDETNYDITVSTKYSVANVDIILSRADDKKFIKGQIWDIM